MKTFLYAVGSIMLLVALVVSGIAVCTEIGHQQKMSKLQAKCIAVHISHGIERSKIVAPFGTSECWVKK